MPESVKSNIEGLVAIHSYDTVRASARAQKLTTDESNETKDVEHPLVRTHEDTHLKSIYFNPNRTDRIVGMARAESDDLLDVIYAWVTREEFQYHHDWRVGDILLWDNRCLLHSVNVDYPVGEKRRHQRILLKGARPA
jgi:taurine dioxygenase